MSPSGVASRVPLGVNDARDRLRRTPEVREALEWMWPVLTPAELLHDLYGSRALLRSAAGRSLSDAEVYAVVAWLLAENEVVGRDAVMDARTLPRVAMPAKGHFVRDDRAGGTFR